MTSFKMRGPETEFHFCQKFGSLLWFAPFQSIIYDSFFLSPVTQATLILMFENHHLNLNKHPTEVKTNKLEPILLHGTQPEL